MHDLKSRLNAATHIYNPSKPPFDKGGFFCVDTQMPNPGFDLKSRLNAAPHIYNPSKPLLWKGGACCKSAIYLTCGERSIQIAILHYGMP